MKERPILFSNEMVRAILAGRKTQTRRVMKPQPAQDEAGHWLYGNVPETWSTPPGWLIARCPYGQPGDRLWVRETWRAPFVVDSLNATQIAERALAAGYTAPWCPVEYANGMRRNWDDGVWGHEAGRLRSGRFMPRWASRITLEITGVRVERLQSISGDDAIAEGIAPLFTEEGFRGRPEFEACRGHWKNYLWHGLHGRFGMGNAKSDAWPHQFSGYTDPRGSYSSLWGSINGAGSWSVNPWVWVIEFKQAQS